MKKILYQNIQTVMDNSTGEILNTKDVSIIQIPPEPPYLKLYFAEVSRLFDLQPLVSSVLLELAFRSGYDGVVGIGKRIKEIIAKNIGSKFQSVDNAITILTKKGLITRIGRGEYEIDPNIFAKGDWKIIQERRNKYKDRLKTLQMVFNIEITNDGKRTIKGNISSVDK